MNGGNMKQEFSVTACNTVKNQVIILITVMFKFT